MFTFPESHFQVENALKIVNRFTHGDQVIGRYISSGNSCKVFSIPLHMFDDFCRILCICIILRYDIVPGQLAEVSQPKPGSKLGKPVQGFSLLFKGGYEVVDHIKENQPGPIMLRSFKG